MAGCRKKHSKLQQANFKQYAVENRAVVNRVKRLKKELTNALTAKDQIASALSKKVEQIQAAIEKAHYRRKKPLQNIWTKATKAHIQLIKFFTGKGHKELISTTKEQHGRAWEVLSSAKRKGKIPADIARLKIMSIGENLPAETKTQLLTLRNNLRAA